MKKTSVLLLASGALISSAYAKQTQPNFLFICIDDFRTEMGAYGYDYMKTPSLDALASEGRLFNSHYVQVPVSGPNRECMLTGIPSKATKEIYHDHYAESLVGTTETDYPESFVHHLKRNGYYTVGMGKISHHANGEFTPKGGVTARELPHSWDNFINDPNSKWPTTEYVTAYADGVCRKAKPLPYQCADVPDDSYPDGVTANLAMAELERLAKSDKPFFLGVGFVKPHLPFTAPKKYWDLYDRDKIAISSNPDRPKNVSKNFIYNNVEFNKLYKQPALPESKIVSDDYAKLIRHAYYAAISFTDAQVGKVISKLKELGLDKNTVIVVWSDHGWMLGDKTIWGKQNVFDRTLNSTFMMKLPKQKQAGKSTNSLIATIDIYPTVCELAGIKPPKDTEGKSFVPILNDPKAKTRDYVVSHWRSTISLKTDRYRVSRFDNTKVNAMMIFDHKNDPDEINNLAGKDAKLTQELTELLRQHNDGFLPKF